MALNCANERNPDGGSEGGINLSFDCGSVAGEVEIDTQRPGEETPGGEVELSKVSRKCRRRRGSAVGGSKRMAPKAGNAAAPASRRDKLSEVAEVLLRGC